MSVSYISDWVKFCLWGKAAGRCQYEGCNHPLYRDDVTHAEFNSAYVAHIVGDKPDGPRGHSTLSEALKSDINNLMLLCDTHHRLVDKVDVAGQLRGDFYDSSSSGRSRTESTMYKGMHWIEGFVVKDGVCVLRTGEFVVNIS